MTPPRKCITVVDLLIERLKECGLQRLFGVPGGGSSMDLIDAARRAGLDFVLTRREDSGMVMAAVTAWLSNAPGLALATKGPGVTSAANGVASAFLDRAPVLFASDGFDDDELRYVSHQYFDQAALLGPVTKEFSLLDGDDPAAQIDALVQAMTGAPKGPCYVELTGAAARREITVANEGGAQDRTPLNAPTVEQFDKARNLIAAAKRPVIIVGLEAATPETAAAIRNTINALNAPALVTYMGKGVVADQDSNFAGIFTGGQAEYACVSNADLIILAGLDPVELIRKPWAYTAPVIDVSEVHHEKHYMTPDCGLYGPVAATLAQLADCLTPSDWTASEIATHRDNFHQAMAYKERSSLTPVDIVKMAASAFAGAPDDTPRLAVDAGAHMFSAIAFWPARQPLDVLISNGLATMAFALPAGLAAALHDPKRGAVAMTGDGGLMMCLGELVTAAQQKANLTVIVFNDGSLSLIDIKRQELQMPDLGFSWDRPDFAAAARGFGCSAWRVSSEAELDDALKNAADADGPCLIDVHLDPDGYIEQMRALRG
ncbi:MAG: thiamine pyrophosphate-binding protein [Rhodospirillaceae bacterium]|nr:thiamine pyrophosphate-binding protein [Rhodospirillaceae bacterium]